MLNKFKRIAQSPGEPAGIYGISTKTLKRMLDKHREKIGERTSLYYTPFQVTIIYECIGPPKPFRK